MTLHIYDHEQRSPEWYAARCGLVTASAIGELITPSTVKVASNDKSRARLMLLASERVTGIVEETFTSADMWRGIEGEPFARDAYAKANEVDVAEAGFMVREFDGFRLGYSPDGLVGDDGLVEIKCPRPKNHLITVVADSVPTYYMAQLQTGLLVTGREWIDFVSYVGGMQLWTKRVTPDPKWQAAILQAAAEAEKAIEQIVDTYLRAVEGLPATERIDFDIKVA